MPSPQLSPAAAALAAIASLQGTIAMARALVVSGRRVDLTGLEREAERLCAAIACLSGARPALEGRWSS